jgi:hypothetical protein
MSQIDQPDPAKVYDDALSWTVRSRSDPHVTYAVDLGAYNANGACPCDDFGFNFQKILAAMITPEEAVERKLVQVREWQRVPANALRCWHIMDAAEQAERIFARSMTAAAARSRR